MVGMLFVGYEEGSEQDRRGRWADGEEDEEASGRGNGREEE